MKQRPPGSLIAARYRVVRVLGEGSYAVTYEAEDLERGDRVAVKELRVALIDRWSAVQRFEREARVLAALEHPRIPAYRDFIAPEDDGEAEGAFVLVQALAHGDPLDRRVRDGPRLDEGEATAIAAQVLEILTYLHALTPPVIHRDIKPENLVIDAEGDVVLVDFGAVRDGLAASGSFGSVVGTFGYMAPEQFQGYAVPSSDLYGLGATLVHLMSGRSPADLPHHRLRLEIRPYIDASPGFVAWLERLLAPAAEDRSPSARDALAALHALGRAPARAAGGDLSRVRGIRAKEEGGALEIIIDENRPPRAGALAVPAALALGFVAFLTLRGAAARPIGILLIMAALGVVAFGALGWPALAAATGRTRLRLEPDGFVIERRALGFTWRLRRGPLAAIKSVDHALQHGSKAAPKTGVALITPRRSVMIASHLDAPAREEVARLIREYLRRHGG